MTKSKQTDELDDTMRVLSTGSCDTLSGSSKLTYHIGCVPDGEIYLRVIGNTGGGFFSQEWISLRDILTALKKRPEGKPITSILLNPLLRGKSANTPGFLLAVLLHEKLVRSMQGKLRRHELAIPPCSRPRWTSCWPAAAMRRARQQRIPPRRPPSRRKHQHPVPRRPSLSEGVTFPWSRK